MTVNGTQFVTKQPAVSEFKVRDRSRDTNTDTAWFSCILLLLDGKGKQPKYSRAGLCGSALLTFLRLFTAAKLSPELCANLSVCCSNIRSTWHLYYTSMFRCYEIRNNYWYCTLLGCDAVNCGREKFNCMLTFCLNLHSTITQISEQSVVSLFEM